MEPIHTVFATSIRWRVDRRQRQRHDLRLRATHSYEAINSVLPARGRVSACGTKRTNEKRRCGWPSRALASARVVGSAYGTYRTFNGSRRESGSGRKADMSNQRMEGRLMTQSGHTSTMA